MPIPARTRRANAIAGPVIDGAAPRRASGARASGPGPRRRRPWRHRRRGRHRRAAPVPIAAREALRAPPTLGGMTDVAATGEERVAWREVLSGRRGRLTIGLLLLEA